MRKSKYLITGITLFLLLLTELVKSQSITIDLNTEYQIIRGFGGMNNPGWIQDLNDDQREKAFGNDPGQIGLSILRMRISPDVSNFNIELPTARYAKEKGALLFASPWSPPASLKSNNNLIRGHLLPENYGAYADHLLEFATFMKNNGVPLYAISIQNEPDWYGANYESCDWTALEMINFLKEQGAKLDTLKVIAAESLNFDHEITDSILNDVLAEPYLDIIGGHLYGENIALDYPLALSKGKEIWMTEHLNKPNDNIWANALETGIEINNCMEASFSEYSWWYIRRFYSFIKDDGNITKKGYVMSHFSKFIRPGAIRVDANVSSAPDVDVTAYKTDTTFVIMVINQNDSPVNLDFSVQNGIVDTLTQYTTSATKNVINDGGVSITGGSFSVSVDASSITTFTSYTGNAGKYGNAAPVADAGSDIVVDDLNGSGIDTVAIDGSASSDLDGTIVNYSWSVDSMYYSSDTVFEFIASIGVHELVLTVTDNDGATDSDTITVTVNSPFSTEIWLEAECGEVGSTWEQTSDATASNGIYVAAPLGTESLNNASADTADLIIFTFDVSESGTYKVWGRVITPTANDDSYWVNMDNSTNWTRWNSIPAGSDWHWDDVHEDSDDNPVGYALDPGEHTLSICFREDGALLDKIYIANDGTVPSGMGDTATNCPEDTTSAIIEFANEEITHISVFPNPAGDEVQVVWDKGFNSLLVYSVDGRFMIDKKYPDLIHETKLDLELKQGIYFLLLSNEKTSDVAKLIIE